MNESIEDLNEREIFVLIALHLGKSQKRLNRYSDELNHLVKRGFVNWIKHEYELTDEIEQVFTEIFEAYLTLTRGLGQEEQLGEEKQH